MQNEKPKMKNSWMDIHHFYRAAGCIILIASGALTAEAADLSGLRQQLFAGVGQHADDVRARKAQDAAGAAVDSLLIDGSTGALDILGEYLVVRQADRMIKRKVLERLGSLGTPGALREYDDFETWAREQTLDDQGPFYFGYWDYAVWHFEPHELKPLAICTQQGVTWAVFMWNRYGHDALWLTSSVNRLDWTAPLLINPPQMKRVEGEYYRKTRQRFASSGEGDLPYFINETLLRKTTYSLSYAYGIFTLKVNRYRLDFTRADLLRDGDNDGLPDAAEQMLGTDPGHSDTDGDGVADGRDGNPLTSGPGIATDPSLVRQAVFSYEMATSNSRDAVFFVGDTGAVKQEYYGYRGYVLAAGIQRRGRVNLYLSRLTIVGDSASVGFGDYEAELAASGHSVYLKKIHGNWYVVKTDNYIIS